LFHKEGRWFGLRTGKGGESGHSAKKKHNQRKGEEFSIDQPGGKTPFPEKRGGKKKKEGTTAQKVTTILKKDRLELVTGGGRGPSSKQKRGKGKGGGSPQKKDPVTN